MKKIFLAAAFLAAVLINAQQQKPKLIKVTYQDSIQTISKKNWTTVNVSYFKIKDYKNHKVEEKINNEIEELVFNSINQFNVDTNVSSIKIASQEFLKEFENYNLDYPEENFSWMFTLETNIIFSSKDYLSLSFITEAYTGGAHGMYSIKLQTFNLQNGNIVELSEIIEPKDSAIFIRFAEDKFRKQFDIENQPLSEAGFSFEKDVFYLPQNFAITDDGLYFIYNPYKIAPFSMGVLELRISKNEINSLLKKVYKKGNKKMETAVLGAGCFWCVEAIFQRLNGVKSVLPGYSGGHVENPTYEQVCNKNTGHVEVAKIEFDPNLISYKDILEVFWKTHDPTTLNKQGNDEGEQYRSVVFYSSEEQKSIAEEYKKKLDDSKIWQKPIVTTIEPLVKFWPAEDYHKNYFNENSDKAYCQFVIQPKVEKFKKVFENKLKNK